MKRLIYLCGILFSVSLAAQAQSNNAILFTENGEKFQVILNGILQNGTPQTNVKLTGLNAPNYKCRVIFEDKALGYLDWNMIFPEMGEEVTWNIKKNGKGQFVTRYVSDIPVAQAPPPPPTQTVVVFTTTPAVVETATTVQQTQTTTTTSGVAPGSDNVNIHLGVNTTGNGGSVDIRTSGTGMDIQEQGAATSTTTTTTRSVTTTTTGTMPPGGVMVANTPPAPIHVVYVDGYNGPIGCPVPMNPGDFESMKSSISSKDFENTKLTIAKQVLQNNCLTASQVREVMSLFDFENTKLDYAKYAYTHTYDKGNYFKVNDAFQFESSVDDLNRYISTK